MTGGANKNVMKKILFMVGILVFFSASLLWVSSSSASYFRMTLNEFIVLLAIGFLMMVPELIYQVRQFFSSGTSNQIPF